MELVLIDDDPLVHMTWKVKARLAGKTVSVFASGREFLEAQARFPRDTDIYVDAALGAGESGLDLCQTLVGLGFAKPILATGHDADRLPASPFVRRVQGKDPPF